MKPAGFYKMTGLHLREKCVIYIFEHSEDCDDWLTGRLPRTLGKAELYKRLYNLCFNGINADAVMSLEQQQNFTQRLEEALNGA